MTYMEKDFLRYLESSLDAIYKYFLSDAWLSNQSNIKILTNFILSCAFSYPDIEAKIIFNNSAKHKYENYRPKELWMSNASRLIEIAQEIAGRKRSGPNDPALCRRVKSKIRPLQSTTPDNWVGNPPRIPEEVIRIIDEGCRYYNSETKR